MLAAAAVDVYLQEVMAAAALNMLQTVIYMPSIVLQW
jgi:hypothetical protein